MAKCNLGGPLRSLLIVRRNSLAPTFEDAFVDDGDSHGNNEDNDPDEITKIYHQHPGSMKKRCAIHPSLAPLKEVVPPT